MLTIVLLHCLQIPSTGSKEIIEEAKYINLSLHYLENVIVSLRDQSTNLPNSSQEKNSKSNGLGHGHIPYRNCILTSILRDSLGGNCRSGFILTLSMDRQHFEESVSTCRYVRSFPLPYMAFNQLHCQIWYSFLLNARALFKFYHLSCLFILSLPGLFVMFVVFHN